MSCSFRLSEQLPSKCSENISTSWMISFFCCQKEDHVVQDHVTCVTETNQDNSHAPGVGVHLLPNTYRFFEDVTSRKEFLSWEWAFLLVKIATKCPVICSEQTRSSSSHFCKEIGGMANIWGHNPLELQIKVRSCFFVSEQWHILQIYKRNKEVEFTGTGKNAFMKLFALTGDRKDQSLPLLWAQLQR